MVYLSDKENSEGVIKVKEVKLNKNECSGCGCCTKICPVDAISFKQDVEGFYYPAIDTNKCIECNKCINICPFNKKNFIHMSNEPLNIYAVKCKDKEIVKKSTSGGAFTVLSDFTLNNNGVVYGVVYDEEWNVSFLCAKNEKDRNKMRGSKYVQSYIENIYIDLKKQLDENKNVLFVGTPCQCAGLSQYLNKNYENLLICDIVCHGVPSPKIFKEYIKFLQEKRKSKIRSYNFRDKNVSWNGANVTVVYENGKKFTNKMYEEIFSKLYFDHIITRPSCHNCIYTNIKRVSDITIGDFWGIEKSHPDFYDKSGVSLVLVNTIKGKKYFNNITDSINYIESNTIECNQPQLNEPIKESKLQIKFWNDYSKYGFNYILKKYTCVGIKKRIIMYIKKQIKLWLNKSKKILKTNKL